MEFNQNQEIWRSINEYVNYEVSNHGRVRNTKTGLIMKQTNDKDGYKKITLSQNGKKGYHRVHILVAQEFIENPRNYPSVDHIDREKDNNYFQNLRWANQPMQGRNTGIYVTNTSGIKGVRTEQNGATWRATISDARGKQISKSFSVKKYPDAKERAIAWRRAKEIEYNYNQD